MRKQMSRRTFDNYVRVANNMSRYPAVRQKPPNLVIGLLVVLLKLDLV